MVARCSSAVSEDRGHTSKVDGPESLAISICDVSYKLMNYTASHSLPCGHAYQPSTVELSCYVREISHCPCDGVRRQMSYSSILKVCTDLHSHPKLYSFSISKEQTGLSHYNCQIEHAAFIDVIRLLFLGVKVSSLKANKALC